MVRPVYFVLVVYRKGHGLTVLTLSQEVYGSLRLASHEALLDVALGGGGS